MQRVTIVRYTVKPGHAATNETLSRAVFTQLHDKPPAGVAYALFRDGNEFLHVFVNLQADDSAPITELPAFKAFEKDIIARCEVPPQLTRLAVHLVDSFGFNAPMTADRRSGLQAGSGATQVASSGP